MALCVVLMIIILASGCLGGNESEDAWNDEVSDTNDLILAGKTSYEAYEDALDAEQYDIAYLNIDDAIAQYEDALDNLDDLRDVAVDLDKDFLDDYLDAWEGNLNELIDIAYAGKMMALIMEYNYSRENFYDYDTPAANYFNTATASYNNDLLDQAIDNANMAYDHYAEAKGYSDRMVEIGSILEMPHVVDYANMLSASAQYLLDACTNIVNAANLKESDVSQANQYAITVDDLIKSSKSLDEEITDLYDLYPDLYEKTNGMLFWDLFSYYQDIKNSARVAANDYRQDMDDIVEENGDYFK
ncbi:MAG: hypothetical protein JW825_00875 [Candidatus Methanofastidiosa archaeon]|nr:hypothetical protein [Candidatus Methanofastidiosa archaeon]